MLYEIISSNFLLRYTQVQIASPELCLKQCKYVVPSDSNTMFETRKKQSVYLVLLWFYTCTCWQGMGMWKITKWTAARRELSYKFEVRHPRCVESKLLNGENRSQNTTIFISILCSFTL